MRTVKIFLSHYQNNLKKQTTQKQQQLDKLRQGSYRRDRKEHPREAYLI